MLGSQKSLINIVLIRTTSHDRTAIYLPVKRH